MRGSSEGFNKIVGIEPDMYEMSANLLCSMEEFLEHGKIPQNWEHVLDVCIDVLRDVSADYQKRLKLKKEIDNIPIIGGIFDNGDSG